MEKLFFDYSDEFETFLLSIPEKDRVKLLMLIQKIEEHGLQIAIKMKWVKKIDHNLYEIRSKVGSNIQRAFYFQIIRNKYYITHGFTKKTEKTPKKEIERALRIRSKHQGGENNEQNK